MDSRYKNSLSPEVLNELNALKELRQAHIDMGSSFIGLNLPILMTDLFFAAAVNRSMSLLKGFCTLIEQQNFVAAAPLIRLELDCCLRVSAAHLSEDLGTLAFEVMSGKAVRKLKDRDGELMHDTYLVRKMSERYPWVQDVYTQTSGYVHLSEKHYFNAMQAGEKEGDINIKISDIDAFIPDKEYIQAIHSFEKAIDILNNYVRGYGVWKQRQYGNRKEN